MDLDSRHCDFALRHVAGAMVVDRRTYWRIGGGDERFTGWGGEDTDFYERLLTVGNVAFGSSPLIHLYHYPSAPAHRSMVEADGSRSLATRS